MRKIVGILIGAGIGGVIGYSQILCFGGQCAIVGSWQGGAMLGVLIGMMFTGGG